MRPFPIYPLYTQTVILSLDKPIADCFLFRPRKSRKSAGNAVIPTFPTHWSHGLQHLRHKRRNVRFEGLRRVHTLPQPLTAHTAAYTAKQGGFGWGRCHYPRTVLRGSETLRGRVSEQHTLPFCAREECVGKKQRAFWTSTHALCVDVQRRRGPAGTRSPAAGSCAAPASFTVCHRFVEIQERAFTRLAVPTALSVLCDVQWFCPMQ